jgi:hypothetical protein
VRQRRQREPTNFGLGSALRRGRLGFVTSCGRTAVVKPAIATAGAALWRSRVRAAERAGHAITYACSERNGLAVDVLEADAQHVDAVRRV